MSTAIFGQVTRRAAAFSGLMAIALGGAPAGAVIDPAHQFITNGDFEQTTNGLGQVRRDTNAVGWTSQLTSGNYGFTFLFDINTVSNGGVPGETGPEMLWGPGNGANNGFVASPTGGNFIGADGAYHVSKLTQQISGLIVGAQYTLTFNFAGAQEYNYGNGPSTDSWKFGLNSGTQQQTAILNNTYKGFTGWYQQTYNFTATQTNDTLYFLAAGTPGGQPPFSLLDSVSLVGAYDMGGPTAPEPGTWVMMMIGFGIVGASLRRRNRQPQLRAQIA